MLAVEASPRRGIGWGVRAGVLCCSSGVHSTVPSPPHPLLPRPPVVVPDSSLPPSHGSSMTSLWGMDLAAKRPTLPESTPGLGLPSGAGASCECEVAQGALGTLCRCAPLRCNLSGAVSYCDCCVY